jgi:uncharacterized damage-inducible protein DinB
MKRIILVAVVAVSSAVHAQQPPAQTPAQPPAPLPGIITEVKNAYTSVQNNIVRAAEQFPAEKLTWQPTPAVRSWARLIGHIIDDNNGACWLLAGEAQAPPRVDTVDSAESPANKLSKDDLVKGLKESVERCNKAFANVNETNMGERNGPTGRRSKLFTLMYNTSHTNEHYGNIATYMRLNNLVPPSSQPRGQ